MEPLQNDNENVSLKKIIIKYLVHWKIFAVAFVLSLALAIAYLVIYPKTYEIIASVQLQEDNLLGSSSFGLGEASGLMKSFGLGGISTGNISMDDEIAKLSSVDLVRKVVSELGLNVSFFKPNSYKYVLYKDAPFVIKTDSVTNAGLSKTINFDFKVDAAGKIELETKVNKEKQSFKLANLPAEIVLPEGTFIISSAENGIKPYSIKASYRPCGWTAEDFIDRLKIEDYSKSSTFVEFLYKDYETDRGVDLLNTLIASYNEQEKNYQSNEGGKSIQFLDNRIHGVLQELMSAEYAIEGYKNQNQMTDLEYDLQFHAEYLKNLQIQIIELEAQAHLIDMVNRFVLDPANKYNLIPALLSASEGEKGSAISAYNEVLLERARILQTSKADNPLILNLNSQIDQLRESVILSIQNAKESLVLTLGDLKTREKSVLDKISSVPVLEREYIDLRRKQEILQAVYLILLQKREEIALSVGEGKDRARIIVPAYVKEKPVAPRKLFAAIGLILFSIILPVIYLFIKEQIQEFVQEFRKEF